MSGMNWIRSRAAVRAAAALSMVLLALPAFPEDPGGQQLDRLVGVTLRSPFLRQAAPRLLDTVGGRPTGTPNGRRAEELAAEIFREAGLPLVRTEAFSVPLWQPQRASVTLVEPALAEIRCVPLANSASTPAQGLRLPVVDAGYGTPEELAALGGAVSGAAVLVRTGRPAGGPWHHRSEKYSAVVAAGAAAFLYAPERPGQPVRSGTVTLDGSPGAIPALSIPAQMANWLARLDSAGAAPVVRIVLMAERRPATAHNVVADLPGKEPGEVILAGAHLDSWDQAQGAGDNGTGTLVLWQAAQALVAQGLRPRRTIRFVSFMGEEIGLLGSKAYVRDHAGELESVRAMLNLDMVGEPTGFGSMLQPGLDPLLRQLAGELAGMGLSGEISHSLGLHSDHAPFLLAGVPVVRLRSRLPEAVASAYHSDRDTLDTLDLGQLQRAAAVTAALLWRLANEEPLTTRSLDPREVARALDEAGIQHPPVENGPAGAPSR